MNLETRFAIIGILFASVACTSEPADDDAADGTASLSTACVDAPILCAAPSAPVDTDGDGCTDSCAP